MYDTSVKKSVENRNSIIFLKQVVGGRKKGPQIANPKTCGLTKFTNFEDLSQMCIFADLRFADPFFSFDLRFPDPIFLLTNIGSICSDKKLYNDKNISPTYGRI